MADPGWDIDNTCVSIFSRSQVVGMMLIAQSGIISTVAVLIFLTLVARNVIRNRLHPGPGGPKPLIRTHVDGYMLSLMFADLIQGLGAIINTKWAVEGRAYCSSVCNAQGALKQLGETGVAMSTLAITVHTFITIFFRRPPSTWWTWIVVVGLIWTYILVFVLIGIYSHFRDERHGGQSFYGPTPFWCWIKEPYLVEKILGEYFWLWFCAIVNIFLYIPLFFVLRGNIEVNPEDWRQIRFHRREKGETVTCTGTTDPPHGSATPSDSAQTLRNREAMKMFWYPLSYTFIVLPLTIRRWIAFGRPQTYPVANENIASTAAALVIFGLSGIINVTLFMLTRPNILLFGERREALRRSETSVEEHHLRSKPSFGRSGRVATSCGTPRSEPRFLADSDDGISLRFDALSHQAGSSGLSGGLPASHSTKSIQSDGLGGKVSEI